MRFETNNQSKFLEKWTYSASLNFSPKTVTAPTGEEYERWRSQSDRDQVDIIELYLKYKAEGEWIRKGNTFYLNALGDAFLLRLYFSDHFTTIKRADPIK